MVSLKVKTQGIFLGNHQICDLKCSVYPIFFPQMLCFVQSFILFLQNVSVFF